MSSYTITAARRVSADAAGRRGHDHRRPPAAAGRRATTCACASSPPSRRRRRSTPRTSAGATAATTHDASAPPYTALHILQLEPGERLRWHAELESPQSGARTRSPEQEVLAPHGDERLVLLATSCEQFSGVPRSRAYAALAEAAPARPAALVFQGDLGYANNIFHSCYLSAPDFFADRFRRLLAGRDFADLRAAGRHRVHDRRPRLRAAQQRRPHHRRTLGGAALEPDPRRSGAGRLLRLPLRRRALPHARRAPLRRPGGHAEHAAEDAHRQAPSSTGCSTILETSDARLFVIFSAGIFASRYHVDRLLADRLAERVRPGDAPVPRRAARAGRGCSS